MESFELPLDRLTLAQKLHLMEAIWDDLGRQKEPLASPQWHEDILEDRESALAAGKVTFSDWDVVKNRIRVNVS